MRKFISIAVAALFFTCVSAAYGQPEGFRYMAFCTDSDGAVSEWVTTRDDAYIAGRDHERAHRGHRWEVLVQHGRTAVRPPSCAVVADDTDRPNTVKIVNTCGACRIFKVSRRNADGSVKSKEFKVKPNSQRRFRKVADSEIIVEAEGDCPGT
jgi:hypothetical protein